MNTCWCGLPESHHDGREMDREGNMHLFGKPVYNPDSNKAAIFDEDKVDVSQDVVILNPASSFTLPLGLAQSVKKFLDGCIIRMQQNGFKFPGGVVEKAIHLSSELSSLLGDQYTEPESKGTVEIQDRKTEKDRHMEFLRAKYKNSGAIK